MAFDPALSTTRDEIRFLIADTVEPYLIPDATIDAKIAAYDDWRLAAADVAEALAVQLERQVTSFTSPGDFSAGWADKAKSLRATAVRLRAEVAQDAGLAASPIVSTALARDDVPRTVEYAAARYRRMWR